MRPKTKRPKIVLQNTKMTHNAECRMQDAGCEFQEVGCRLCTVYCVLSNDFYIMPSIFNLLSLTTHYKVRTRYLLSLCSLQHAAAAGSREQGAGRRSQVAGHCPHCMHSAQCTVRMRVRVAHRVQYAARGLCRIIQNAPEVGCWMLDLRLRFYDISRSSLNDYR